MPSARLLEILVEPGPDAAIDFLERIHGRLRPADGIPDEDLRPFAMPPILRRYLNRAGGTFWSGQNELLSPTNARRLIERGMRSYHDDRLTFYVENQHVFEWSTLLDGDDPPVWRRSLRGAVALELAPLSVFLLQTRLLEFSLLGSAAPALPWDLVKPDELAALQAQLVRVTPPFGDPPTHFWANDDVVMQVADGSAWIGATSEAARDALSLSGDWHHGWDD
jgi:hypothetical protein